MDKYTATELAYKHGYEKGYEAAKKEAESEMLILKQKRANIFEIANAYERGFAKASKWIPVSERFPMEGVYVLCFSTECVKPLGVYAYIGNGKWEEPDNNWNYGDLLGITHWMPLPEPPKEGER